MGNDLKISDLDKRELALLKADIKAELLKELTGQDLRAVREAPKPLRVVWDTYREPLYKRYGAVTYAQVWDCIRKLAVFWSGHRYVRDLLPSEEEEAAAFAEMILEQMGIEIDKAD